MTNNKYWHRILILTALGFIGVLSALPIIPKLITLSGQEPPMSMPMLQLISTVQSTAILFGLVMLGAWAAPQVQLNTPITDAILDRNLDKLKLKPILIPSFVGGIVSGMLLAVFAHFTLPYLPQGFLVNAQAFSPPYLARLFYGGITEEILMRWGLMSILVWGSYRLTQQNEDSVKPYNYVVGIVIAAILFGLGHLPTANMLSPVVTNALVWYIIIGNSLFGFIAGYLFWKKGLESAIIAHIVTHVTMIVIEVLNGS